LQLTLLVGAENLLFVLINARHLAHLVEGSPALPCGSG
jgi:hypothetical protein